MPVGSETIICGQYTCTYGGVALGIMEGDAGVPTLERVSKGRPIADTDAYGQSTIDYVYLGADFYASFTCQEYKAGPLAAWWPWSGTLGRMGVVGRLAYDTSAALVLTSISGTPAVTSPATLTASKAILPPGDSSRLMYGPMVRVVPIRLQLLPYTNSVVVWYTQT